MPKLGKKAHKVEGLFEEGIAEDDLATFHDVLIRMLENVGEAHFAVFHEEGEGRE